MLNTCSNWRMKRKVTIRWEHAPRTHVRQQWADWLGRCARAAGKHVSVWDIVKSVPAEGVPPKDLGPVDGADMVAVGFHDEGDGILPKCAECRKHVREGQLQCGMCRKFWHRACSKPHHHGPWHCTVCRKQARADGVRDVTLDEGVVDYLATKQLPGDADLHPRIIKSACKLYCDARGTLWAKDAWGRPTRRIPPIGERRQIILEAMRNLLYPGGERLY